MAGALVKAGAFVYVGNGRSVANADPDSAAATTTPLKICFIEISSNLSAARAAQPDAMQTCTTPARRGVTQRVDAGRFSRFGLHLKWRMWRAGHTGFRAGLCTRSLSSGAHSRGPLARNDGRVGFLIPLRTFFRLCQQVPGLRDHPLSQKTGLIGIGNSMFD